MSLTRPGVSAGAPAESAAQVSPRVPATKSLLQPLWAVQYRIALVTTDLCAIILATILGYELRFGAIDLGEQSATYLIIGFAITIAWVIGLQYCGGYEVRHLATGPEETKRVLRASALTLSLLAIACYATHTAVARGYVIGVIPLGAIFVLATRAGVRRFVAERRAKGAWVHRIVAVGTRESVCHLLEVTQRANDAGLLVIGACVEDASVGSEVSPGVPVLGGVLEAAQQAEVVGADVVAVTASGLGPRGVRELGWQLEGTGRGLVLAPALTEIAGTRMHISPVDGLPLVWLDEPQLGRVPRLLKRSLDLLAGVGLLALASPILLFTAIAIKATSRGPVLFRQRRLGVNGTEFNILKFRSMYVDAESRRVELLKLNEQDGGGVLFKLRRDPRVTSVGRWIRKFSIDELPQLFHVIAGTMSLVGPRPLASADSVYTGAARRRLLVRPGMTGLWQISGRSELSWDDAVRLDLYYVENWSLGMDLSILMRTIFAVLGRKGAY